MALALTSRDTESNATDGDDPDVTTTTFTPSNSSILVVLAVSQNQGTATGSPAISGGGLTYTSRAKARSSGNFAMWAEIWTAPVATGASMTVTVNNSGNTAFGAVSVAVVDLTGYDTTTPTGVNVQATTGARSGAYSPALSGTAAADSIVLIAGGTDFGTATKHASWTDIYTGTAAAGGTDHKFSMSYRSGALTTADWAALDSSFSTAAAGIEIKAAAAGGSLSVNLVGRGGLAGAGGLAGVGGGLVGMPRRGLILPHPSQIKTPERRIYASR